MPVMKSMGVRQKVLQVLKEHPITRGSDPWLIGYVYQKFYGIEMDRCTVYDMLDRINKDNLPAFESIRRVRCEIQADGKYIPLEKDVLKKRKKSEVKVTGRRYW